MTTSNTCALLLAACLQDIDANMSHPYCNGLVIDKVGYLHYIAFYYSSRVNHLVIPNTNETDTYDVLLSLPNLASLALTGVVTWQLAEVLMKLSLTMLILNDVVIDVAEMDVESLQRIKPKVVMCVVDESGLVDLRDVKTMTKQDSVVMRQLDRTGYIRSSGWHSRQSYRQRKTKFEQHRQSQSGFGYFHYSLHGTVELFVCNICYHQLPISHEVRRLDSAKSVHPICRSCVDEWLRTCGSESTIVSNTDPRLCRIEPTELTCEICCETYPTSQMFKHEYANTTKYCNTCIIKHAQHRIIQRRIPIDYPDSSSKKLTYDMLQPILDLDHLQKLSDPLLRSAIASFGPSLFWFNCQTPDCSNGVLYSKCFLDTAFKCQVCDVNWCARCKCSYHEGTCCTDYQFTSKNFPNAIDGTFTDLINKKTVQLCPHCNTPSIRIGGCRQVTCTVCDWTWEWYQEPQVSIYPAAHASRSCWSFFC
ncbi:Hypothetical protein MVR_LOCUS11 [uncultured virus]|nr:Hypothetical protein MVR_LOCUS11 [uncultured virus]